jgi:SAM-dependent methyltransferase
LEFTKVLWTELITEWRLSDYEVAYIDRQQGSRCTECSCSLRAMALARAFMTCFGRSGLLKDFVRERAFRKLAILEINEAGNLTPFLAEMPGHVLRSYPDLDMMAIPYGEATFELVIHSDTLEHVEHPVRALSECARVLKPGGYCVFTVPIVVDRLTASRAGLRPSYHGSRENPADCLVHTEYGADAWKQVIQAGFQECRLFALEYPSALALVGVKSSDRKPGSVADPLDES